MPASLEFVHFPGHVRRGSCPMPDGRGSASVRSPCSRFQELARAGEGGGRSYGLRAFLDTLPHE